MKIGDFGYNSVFVKIEDAHGGDITDDGLSRFIYIHSEISDDYSEIDFDNLDINFPDNPNLQEGKKLFLTWGYLGGEIKKAIVYIGDSIVTYGETVRMSLKCYDKASFLKNNSSNEVHKNITADELGKKIADANGLTYTGLNKDSQTPQFTFKEKSEKSLPEPVQMNVDGTFRTGRDATSVPKFHTSLIYRDIPQGNKSDRAILDDLMAKENGGPYNITGHDEDLIISKRNFNQKPLRAYSYKNEDGELLEFQAETKNKEKKSTSTENTVSVWDEIDKKFVNVTVTEQTDPTPRLGTTVDGNVLPGAQLAPGIISGTKIKPTDGENPLKGMMVNTESTSGDDGKIDNTEEIEVRRNNSVSSFVNSSDYQSEAIDKTAITLSKYRRTFDANQNSQSQSGNPMDDAKAIGDNLRQMAALEKNPAIFRVLGWPKLESGKLITILGVSHKDSGNYYVIKVTHEIQFDSGYICKGECTRNATNAIKSNQPGKINVRDLKIDVNKTIGPSRPRIEGTTKFITHQ